MTAPHGGCAWILAPVAHESLVTCWAAYAHHSIRPEQMFHLRWALWSVCVTMNDGVAAALRSPILAWALSESVAKQTQDGCRCAERRDQPAEDDATADRDKGQRVVLLRLLPLQLAHLPTNRVIHHWQQARVLPQRVAHLLEAVDKPIELLTRDALRNLPEMLVRSGYPLAAFARFTSS